MREKGVPDDGGGEKSGWRSSYAGGVLVGFVPDVVHGVDDERARSQRETILSGEPHQPPTLPS